MSTYGDLVNVEELGEKREHFSEDRGEIAFYCKDCKDFVDAQENPDKKYSYSCPECKEKNIAQGTKESLKSHFKRKR